MSRDLFKFPNGPRPLDNMPAAMKKADHHPRIGVTQGGSSKRYAGAKPAATKALLRPWTEQLEAKEMK